MPLHSTVLTTLWRQRRATFAGVTFFSGTFVRRCPVQLFMLAAVLLTVLLSANQGPALAFDAASHLALVGLLLLAFAVISSCTARLQIALRFPNAWDRTMLALWLLTVILVCWPLAWPTAIRHSDSWLVKLRLDSLLLFAPLVVSCLSLWSASFDLQIAVNAAVNGIVAPRPAAWRKRGAYLGLRAKFYFGLFLLPAVAMYVLRDLALAVVAPVSNELVEAWLAVPLLLGMAILFPLALRWLWRVEPLEASPLREQLLATSAVARIPLRDVLIWRTDRQVHNAFVVGTTPWFRYVMLTDALVETLTEDEILAVFRHELGHLSRRHLLWRLLLVLAPVAVWLAWLSIHEPPRELRILDGGLWLALAAAFASLAGLLGWCSRHQEHDADLWACSENHRLATPTLSAERVARFAAALERLTPDENGSRTKRDWLHPSVAERLDLLRSAIADPTVIDATRRRLRCFAVGLLVLYAAAVTVIVMGR